MDDSKVIYEIRSFESAILCRISSVGEDRPTFEWKQLLNEGYFDQKKWIYSPQMKSGNPEWIKPVSPHISRLISVRFSRRDNNFSFFLFDSMEVVPTVLLDNDSVG